ncbi:MAG: hypothetical protein K8L99_28730 [Anaerolineae bacterium]|nr:hypothetical protein [Anaerolineae bacterium]
MRPDRATVLSQAPLHDLIVVLLRQYKHLLSERDISLTEADIQSTAQHIVARQALDDREQAIRAVLATLVEESQTVLDQWHLSFAQSLETEMTNIPGWETTAEFLEIANEKGNAELRIASGSALAVALGDYLFAPHLLTVLDHDPNELEGMVARRVLTLVSGVDAEVEDWQAQIQQWIKKRNSTNNSK